MTDTTVGTGTENYRVGVITATTFYGDGSNLTGTGSGYATTSWNRNSSKRTDWNS